MLPLMGDGGRVVEGELPAGEQLHLQPGEGGQILPHPAGVGVIGADHHHRLPLLCLDGRRHMGPVNGGEAGHRHRAPAIFHIRQQFPEFGNPV